MSPERNVTGGAEVTTDRFPNHDADASDDLLILQVCPFSYAPFPLHDQVIQVCFALSSYKESGAEVSQF